ncbi:MAG: protein RarD [Marinovum sp.]|nr:protein RarD [Marinovum sp.]
MSDSQKGILAILISGIIWGFSPLYYKVLGHVPPVELLAHRVVWSVVFFVAVLSFQRRLGALWSAISTWRSAATLFSASFFIGINWFIFIRSIQIEKATEASLGYFIFPLVVVCIGWVGFGERLSRLQNTAIALATVGVVIITVSQGVLPWIALIISISFGLYGYVKKKISTGPVVSVTAEVLLLVPFALAVLFATHRPVESGGYTGGVFGQSLYDSVLLMLSGPLTATPLIFFSYAAKRIPMATLGLLNYVNPTLQFFCAVAIFGEPIGILQFASFGLIWLALALYSGDGFRRERVGRE